jgi:hypothetical protein
MTTLIISKGSKQGPAGTVRVRCAGANWPIINGAGGPNDPHHMIAPSIMEGYPDEGIPADPRLGSWPEDLIAALRVIDAASQPIEYLPVYMGVTIPQRETLDVAYMQLDDTDYVAKLADAYRAAGYEVERGPDI